MTVEQPIIADMGNGAFVIADRVRLACELVETLPKNMRRVRLLEAGAGLDAGHELTIHVSKLA